MKIRAARGRSSQPVTLGTLAAEVHTKFDLSLLRVAADNGYEPARSEIVEWVIGQTHS